MDFTFYLYIGAFISSISSALATVCAITDRNECIYTVVCEGHAGSANNPSCGSDAYISFIIRDSNVDTLTTGFFGATNFDSKVRHIQAINNNWHNIESLAFKYYTKCLEMNLANNNIKNLNNDAFKNLLVLGFLNLSMNAIERLNPSSLIIAEQSGGKLEKLDLSNNLLTEISSEPLAYLTNLKTLYLQNNRLTTLADDCFTNLKNLTTLNLRNNQLTAINMTLINLKSLQGLDISYNFLIKIAGFEINRAGALLLVNMSHNDIEEVESNCFIQAFNLIALDFSNNRIKSPIGNVMFINNNHLQQLNLYNNCIEYIHDNAFKHNDLHYLNLEINYLTGDISKDTFSGLSNVTKLDLYNQNIKAVRQGAFTDMISLVYLNLSKNYIDTLENNSFSVSSSLNILDISHNNVSNLDFLKDSLVSLTELYLNDNKLISIQEDMFVNQTNLKKLDLSINFIVTIEQFSLPLLNLQYLNLNGNRIKGIVKNNTFTPSKYLRFLDLNGFNLTRIEDEALINSPLLARVNLSQNAIEYIGPINFINMDNLYSLDLSYNKLTELKINNSNLYNLKALYLNNNYLKNIAFTFVNISQIVYIDLSNNDIAEISDPIFKTFGNLKVLRLAGNNIKNFNNPVTNSLTQLLTLCLSSNSLTNVNLSYFPDLVDVNLSNNRINFINASFFQNMNHLQSIDLSKNIISELSPGTFQNLKILKQLNLSSNSIQTLRYGSFKGLIRTEVIDLSRNGMHDLDVDIFHVCIELKRLIIDYNFITQVDFDRLVMTVSNLNSLSLGGNPITCKEVVRNYNKGFGRHVEVTSIDKVFEEDNVHGIWCGRPAATTPNGLEQVSPTEPSGVNSLTNLLLIWCTVLTILVLVVGAGSYIYKHKRIVIISGSRSMRNTLELSGSEYRNDLLT